MRHFTVDEANALLPLLRPMLEEMQRLHAEIRDALVEAGKFAQRARQNGHGEGVDGFSSAPDVAEIRRDLGARIDYLQEIGVHLKDIESGILDFPTKMLGRDVYLCWQLGEECVTHWHDIESGFAARRPL